MEPNEETKKIATQLLDEISRMSRDEQIKALAQFIEGVRDGARQLAIPADPTIFWKLLTPRRIFTMVSSAPSVAGPWTKEVQGHPGTDGCPARYDFRGGVLVAVFQVDAKDHPHVNRWTWTSDHGCFDAEEEIPEAFFDTEEQAKTDADLALTKIGWKLV